MSIRHLAQPYVVYTPWEDRYEDELIEWLEKNVQSYYLVTLIANGAWILPARTDRKASSQKLERSMLQFHFECPRDALLFKMTWGER